MVGGLRILCWTLIQNGCVGLDCKGHAWKFLRDCWNPDAPREGVGYVQIVLLFQKRFGKVINLILLFVLFHSVCWLVTMILISLLKCCFPKPRRSIMPRQMSLNPQSSGASPIPAFQVCIYLNGSSFPLKSTQIPVSSWFSMDMLSDI